MRYRHQIALRLVWNRESYISMTEDVSVNGMRLLTDALPPLRARAEIIMHLPQCRRAVALNAYVAHTGLVEGTTQNSVGLCFDGNDEQVLTAWAQFVESLRIAGARRYARESNPPVLSLRPETIDKMDEVQRRAERGAQIFVETEVVVSLGEPVRVAVVHPRSQRLLVLGGTVCELWASAKLRGAVVAFDELDEVTALEVKSFVYTGETAPSTWALDTTGSDMDTSMHVLGSNEEPAPAPHRDVAARR